MKITDDNLDELFRSQLNEENKFQKAEDQWTVVAKRLARGGERKPLLWIFGLVVLGSLSFVFLPYSKTQGHDEQYLSEVVEIPGVTETERTLSKMKEAAAIVENASAKPKVSQVLSVTKLPKNSKATASLSQQLAPRQEKAPHQQMAPQAGASAELCHCPADSLLLHSSALIAYSPTSALQATSINSYTPPTKIQSKEQNPLSPQVLLSPEVSVLPLLKQQLVWTASKTTSLTSPLSSPQANPAASAPTIGPKKKAPKLRLAVGVLGDIYGSAFKDSSSVAPYLALEYQLSRKLRVRLAYDRSEIRRTFGAAFSDYELDATYFVPQESSITQGTAQYKKQTIDFGLAYQILEMKGFGVSILGGLLMEQRSAGSLDLSVSSVYATVVEKFRLEAEPLALSKSYLGAGCRLPIINRLGLEFQVKKMLPISSRAINWGSHYRWSLGLNYRI